MEPKILLFEQTMKDLLPIPKDLFSVIRSYLQPLDMLVTHDEILGPPFIYDQINIYPLIKGNLSLYLEKLLSLFRDPIQIKIQELTYLLSLQIINCDLIDIQHIHHEYHFFDYEYESESSYPLLEEKALEKKGYTEGKINPLTRFLQRNQSLDIVLQFQFQTEYFDAREIKLHLATPFSQNQTPVSTTNPYFQRLYAAENIVRRTEELIKVNSKKLCSPNYCLQYTINFYDCWIG